MAADKNNGAVQYGTRVLTIGSAAGGTGGATYVAEQLEVSRPTKTIERTNELDEPNGQVTYAGFITGSATLQLASGSVVYPLNGYEFTSTFITSVGAEVFYLDSIGQSFSQGDSTKVNVTFRKMIS